MSNPGTDQPQRSPAARFLRRTAAAALIGIVFFGVLWMTVFNAVTAALVSSGTAIVLVGGASVSETFQSIFETIAEIVLGMFSAIAELISGLFDWG